MFTDVPHLHKLGYVMASEPKVPLQEHCRETTYLWAIDINNLDPCFATNIGLLN